MSELTKEPILKAIGKIEVEAVVGGVLQKITFESGFNPADILASLKLLDENTKVRDDFPAKSAWGGNRETKTAYVLSIRASNTGAGKFIELAAGRVVDGKEEEVLINVGKDDSDKWLENVIALGKLTETQLDKLNHALNDKNGKASLILKDAQCFGAEYYESKNGSAYLSKMTVEHPAKPEE